MTYEEDVAFGASQYSDATTALMAAGLPAEFTQTGGMCGALVVLLEAGWYLLITDQNDTLSWERDQHAGWRVGLYPPDQSNEPGPTRWADSERSDVATLLQLASTVLAPDGDDHDAPS